MDDVKRFLEAVTAMRAAQKLEMDALPANFRIWKRTRRQLKVSQLEEQVDQLAQELMQSDIPEENMQEKAGNA
jgi:hypothetical protein